MKKPFNLCFLFVLAVVLTSCTGADKSKPESQIWVGIAEANYTPEVGLNLVGNYRGDDYSSRGVHDSLYGRAIVARGAENIKVALLSIDICSLTEEPVNFIRNYIASKTDIQPENIMVHATHTHSGPESGLDAPMAKEYLSKAAEAVILANNSLEPAILEIGKTNEDRVSFNRRLQYADGTTRMCWESLDPDSVLGFLGPKDPEMITLTIKDKKSESEKGVIVNFGCHPTTLTGNNWLYSADYPGYLVESIRKVKGHDYLPMFVNGCCGNVTQVDYRVGFIDTYQECQRIGYILGVSALHSMKNTQRISGGKVDVSSEMVPLKRITITDQQLEWARRIMKKVEIEGMPPLQADGIPDAQYAKDWLKLNEVQDQVDSLEVMVFCVGDLAFVGLPGEIFAEFGMQIKEQSPCENTIVMGLCNDDKNYFPTKESFYQGPKGFTPMITGYETTPGTTLYEKDAGEKLMNSALRQLNDLFVSQEDKL